MSNLFRVVSHCCVAWVGKRVCEVDVSGGRVGKSCVTERVGEGLCQIDA